MKNELHAHARALGFDACRVARCGPAPHAPQFHAWLSAGYAAEMHWLARNADQRCDPRLVLPAARSVIVLTIHYWQGPSLASAPGQPTATSGRIARYAWGDDYHDVLRPRLRELDKFLQSHGGTQKCHVDTGPVLERDFASAAGAGWTGKSAMQIDPQRGAWFFLAVILTTLNLEPDTPLPDRCGRCTRCLDACPTGAIIAPYTVDSRRCISYLTIENKGPIPETLRPLVGARIFGCDDCIEACPWNRFARVSRETAFQARPFVNMPLRDLLALDDAAFRRLFHKSPILRARRRGLLRNVCVALGNVGGPQDLPALAQAVCDPEPLIADHAAWAVRQIQNRSEKSTDDLKNEPGLHAC